MQRESPAPKLIFQSSSPRLSSSHPIVSTVSEAQGRLWQGSHQLLTPVARWCSPHLPSNSSRCSVTCSFILLLFLTYKAKEMNQPPSSKKDNARQTWRVHPALVSHCIDRESKATWRNGKKWALESARPGLNSRICYFWRVNTLGLHFLTCEIGLLRGSPPWGTAVNSSWGNICLWMSTLMNIRCCTNGIMNGSNSPSVHRTEAQRVAGACPMSHSKLVMVTGLNTLHIDQRGLTCPWGHSVM